MKINFILHSFFKKTLIHQKAKQVTKRFKILVQPEKQTIDQAIYNSNNNNGFIKKKNSRYFVFDFIKNIRKKILELKQIERK